MISGAAFGPLPFLLWGNDMKFKYRGPDEEITLRDVTFPKGKAVDLTDSPELAAKVAVLDYFAEVKPRKRRNDQDKH